jgi:hypothetical protein
MDGFDMAVTIIELCVSFLGLAFGVWQFIENSKLRNYIKPESMELYLETITLLGNAQACLVNLKAGNSNLALENAGKVEGLAQALTQRSIRNVYHNFNFTREKVEEWVKTGKIQEMNKSDFLKYAEK